MLQLCAFICHILSALLSTLFLQSSSILKCPECPMDFIICYVVSGWIMPRKYWWLQDKKPRRRTREMPRLPNFEVFENFYIFKQNETSSFFWGGWVNLTTVHDHWCWTMAKSSRDTVYKSCSSMIGTTISHTTTILPFTKSTDREHTQQHVGVIVKFGLK